MADEFTGERIVSIPIEDEMRVSYLDYSMSVIVNRALPDVRDGLKPVHRRIMVAMNELNLSPDRPYRKSAKITGDVNGNYHPHGTSAIYETLVRMAQTFSLRYPLVDGQGNFGSVDGDAPAAERYTEARLTRMAGEMLDDLEKDTVDYRPNYDNTREEPVVLPGKFPNLLVNGTAGIAVGMATNIPPHNLREIVDATIRVIDEPEVPDEELLKIVTGPDFPTAGIIMGRQGIRNCYLTGRGLIRVRARAEIEIYKHDRERIIVTEIPYMVNKATLLETIAGLVREGQIPGISDLRDESDREGMRIVIEIKRDVPSQVVLNLLYKHTQMQTTFGAINLALVNNRPEVLTLKQLIYHFVEHRREVVVRRTRFDLAAAEKRAHILEGFRIALDNIEELIKLIRAARDTAEARAGMMARFALSEIQANAILDMRLQRLTGLEREKIEQEYREVIQLIEELRSILASEQKVREIIKGELRMMRDKYGDDRRTEIAAAAEDFTAEDLIADEDMVVTVSHQGYLKRLPVTTYRSQKRGGRGILGAGTRDEDFVQHLFIASTHSYILFFTDRGRCYWLKVYEIPEGSRQAKGKSIVNLVTLARDEKVTALVPVREFDENHFLILVTRSGTIKKTTLAAYGNPRRAGIIAIDLKDDDTLVDAALTDGRREILIAKRQGNAIRFNESTVRSMGRTAGGVRGVTLESRDDWVIGMVALEGGENSTVLTVTENGYGKRSPIEDYRITGRGGKGVITIKNTERNGPLVSINEVKPEDQLMIMTKNGVVIRLQISDVSLLGRNTQGVKMVNLDEGDRVVDVARIYSEEDED
jgi:DNA gyrase subunit A